VTIGGEDLCKNWRERRKEGSLIGGCWNGMGWRNSIQLMIQRAKESE